MQTWPNKVIFTVWQKELSTKENLTNLKAVSKIFPKSECFVVEGYYKGESETSLVVNSEYEQTVQALCRKYNQESYLVLNESSSSVLKDATGEVISQLGTFREVSKDYAKDKESYTKLGDKYYLAGE